MLGVEYIACRIELLSKPENLHLYWKARRETIESMAYRYERIPCRVSPYDVVDLCEPRAPANEPYIHDEHPTRSRKLILKLLAQENAKKCFGKETFDGNCFFSACAELLALQNIPTDAEKLRATCHAMLVEELFVFPSDDQCDRNLDEALLRPENPFSRSIRIFANVGDRMDRALLAKTCLSYVTRFKRAGEYVDYNIGALLISKLYACTVKIRLLLGLPADLATYVFQPSKPSKFTLEIAYMCHHYAPIVESVQPIAPAQLSLSTSVESHLIEARKSVPAEEHQLRVLEGAQRSRLYCGTRNSAGKITYEMLGEFARASSLVSPAESVKFSATRVLNETNLLAVRLGREEVAATDSIWKLYVAMSVPGGVKIDYACQIDPAIDEGTGWFIIPDDRHAVVGAYLIPTTDSITGQFFAELLAVVVTRFRVVE